MTDGILIRARGLQRRYMMGKQQVDALAGIDLDVRQGEFVALVGPSGSGKSTLLNIMGTLARPTSGSVEIAGRDVTSLPDR